jgi:hypothetical protein
MAKRSKLVMQKTVAPCIGDVKKIVTRVYKTGTVRLKIYDHNSLLIQAILYPGEAKTLADNLYALSTKAEKFL